MNRAARVVGVVVALVVFVVATRAIVAGAIPAEGVRFGMADAFFVVLQQAVAGMVAAAVGVMVATLVDRVAAR